MEEINVSEAYSPDKVYGQLTAPFVPPSVKINSHTPYDKEDDEAVTVSLSNFRGNSSKFKYAKNDKEDNYSFGLESNYKPNTVDFGTEVPEFPPKSISSFTNSAVSATKDPVRGTLAKGYDYNQAIVIKKAKDAYANAAGLTRDPIGALGQKQVEVKKA